MTNYMIYRHMLPRKMTGDPNKICNVQTTFFLGNIKVIFGSDMF